MKMYKKKKLDYKNGYIVKEGKIIGIDNKIVDMFNQLETDVQKWLHNMKYPVEDIKPAVPFSRETERGKIYPRVTAVTPELDNMAEKTIAMMDELDKVANADMCNKYFKSIQPLIEFINDKFVVECNQSTQHRFDLPQLGNPLKITKEDLCEIVTQMFTD